MNFFDIEIKIKKNYYSVSYRGTNRLFIFRSLIYPYKIIYEFYILFYK